MASERNATMLLQAKGAGIAALIGAVGGVVFLFVFPKGAISTLMHHVLSLPGPGAGIALLLGPAALVFVLISSHMVRGTGGALMSALGFSVVYSLLAVILSLPMNEKGMLGSFWFVLALAACGVVAEAVVFLTRALKPRWRFLLTACVANTGLLVFYWIIIFPRTAGWVSWEAVPSLLAMALAGGIVAGLVGRGISTLLPDFTGPGQRR